MPPFGRSVKSLATAVPPLLVVTDLINVSSVAIPLSRKIICISLKKLSRVDLVSSNEPALIACGLKFKDGKLPPSLWTVLPSQMFAALENIWLEPRALPVDPR